MALRSRIVKIGNSRGIRIPAAVLEQLDMDGEVEIEVDGDRLVIRRRSPHPRDGWLQTFQTMAARGDDALVDPESFSTRWDHDEWQW